MVQFPVNDICDSKCQMCNIWQQKLDSQVTPDDVRWIFSDPVFRDVEAVGMNGGEPTLRADLAELGEALAETLPRLRRISLITNGLRASRAIERIDGLADRLRGHGLKLDVMVSLDGVGPTHDLVRGMPGNFENAVMVLDHLRAKKEEIEVRVGCTIIHDNVYGLHELLDFCRQREVYVKFRLGVPHRRLYNLTPPAPKTIGKRTWIDTQPFALGDAERWHVGQFLLGLARDYEPDLRQRLFYRSLADQVVHGAPRRAGCDWQHRGATISSRGELMYCAVQSDVLGDVRAGGAGELYFGRKDHLDRIIAEKCATCAHDYVGLPGGSQTWQLLADSLMRRTGWSPERLRSTSAYSAATSIRRLANRARFARHRQRLRTRLVAAPATPSAREAPVLVCGWYGTETLGDKAILATIVSAVRRETTQPVHITSLEPELTRLTVAEMPELSGCEVVGLEGVMAAAQGAHAVVFGGGPLMGVRPIADMEALFLQAQRAGVPSIVAGCGIGPIGNRGYGRSIASLLAAASARIYRDEASREAASALGIDTRADLVAEDPAFAWAMDGSDGGRSPDRPTLVLGLRDWPYHQYAPELGTRQAELIGKRIEESLLSALEEAVARVPGLRIAPIPFCTHEAGGDDRLLYWRLVHSSRALRAAFDVSLLSRDLGPCAYRKEIQQATACLAMRFHSIVLSLALGRPVVALDYTMGRGKSHALGRDHGIATHRIDRLDADALSFDLVAALGGEAIPPALPALEFPAAFRTQWAKCVRGKSG